jgi:hypothetical protein
MVAIYGHGTIFFIRVVVAVLVGDGAGLLRIEWRKQSAVRLLPTIRETAENEERRRGREGFEDDAKQKPAAF